MNEAFINGATPSGKELDERSKARAKNRKNGGNKRSNCNYKKTVANDVTWYSKNPALLKDAGSFPFGNPIGNSISLNLNCGGTISPYWGGTNRIAGIFEVVVTPIYGYADSANSPVNVAAKQIYSFVRHANSGHANYDSTDLMLYLMACDQVFSFYNWMQRTYGILCTWGLKNRYIPQALVRACGCDYESLLSHISDFKGYIHQYQDKLAVLKVPMVMDIFKRHSWLFSNVFADSSDPKAGLFVFSPAQFLRYSLDTEGKGCLVSAGPIADKAAGVDEKGKPRVGLSFEEIIAYGDSLTDVLLGSEDIGIMMGDIMKAYGDKLYSFSAMPEDYKIMPSYNEEVLEQIHNAICVGSPDEVSVTQDLTSLVTGPFLRCEPKFIPRDGSVQPYTHGTMVLKGANLLLDSRKESPDPGVVMVDTRLSAIVTGVKPSTGPNTWDYYTVSTLGSEIVNYFRMWTLTDKSEPYSFQFTSVINVKAQASPIYQQLLIATMLDIARFDWHPRFYVTGDEDKVVGQFGDVDNYTIIHPNELYNLNNVALLSLFGLEG